jgi:hypothetical protein
MKNRYRIHTLISNRTALLTLAAALLLPFTAHAQFSIKSWTADGGGGTSSGGTYALTGTIGQPEVNTIAATGGGFTLAGGFWGAESSTTGGYATWAAANISGGQDASFAGDANGNGLPNGIEYIFESQAILSPELGALSAPVNVPSDVILHFSYSIDMENWEPRAKWENSILSILASPANDISVTNTLITDAKRGPEGLGFWRYEAELLTP